MMKHTTPGERKRFMQRVDSFRARGDSVQEACEKAQVKPYNYNHWKQQAKKNGEATAVTRAPRAELVRSSKPKALAVNFSGTSDLMFIGFGKSQDVLQALTNLSQIFGNKIHAMDL